MPSDKTLVILDTNYLEEGDRKRNPKIYSILTSKEDFKDFLEFLDKSGIKDKIIFGIPEITFEEHAYHKTKDFEEDLEEIKDKLSQFHNMEILEEGRLNLKFKESFNYTSFLKRLVESDENFVFLSLDETKKKEIFEKILKKSILHEKPFNKGGDRNFKDAVIWECVCCQNLQEYSKVIFLTRNQEDFPNNEDIEEINYASEKTGKQINILYKYDDLKKELEKTYMFKDKNLKEYILKNSDEFEEKIGMWIFEEDGIPFSTLELTKPCEKISLCTGKDLQDIGLLSSPIKDEEKINLESLRFILVEFKMELGDEEKEKYFGEVLYDLDVKEVLHVRWDLVGDENEQ